MSGGSDDIFGRWSRRRRAVAEEEKAAARTAEHEPETDPGRAPDTAEDETEEQALARLGLPDPDTLGKGDDFSAFMRAGVPKMIRRRALRRLWTSNPVLANLDGLNDYDDDYGAAALSPPVVATAYKVGRGFVRDLLDDAAPRAGENSGEDAGQVTGAAADEAGNTPPAHAADADAATGDDPLSHPSDAPAGAAPSDRGEETENPLRPRRMHFRTNT